MTRKKPMDFQASQDVSVYLSELDNKILLLWWGTILYSPVARQEVEAETWEQEHSGKKKSPSAVLLRPPKKKDVTYPAKKGTELCG